MARTIQLMVIDPQNSFCKVVPAAEQQHAHDGELCVAGGWEDMDRVAGLVARLGNKIDHIKVTMDSHQMLHIAHPVWYRDSNGNQPAPFTMMREENGRIMGFMFDPSYADNEHWRPVGEYRTVRQGMYKRTVNYLQNLAGSKRYPHIIWPPHCIIGTPGHNIVKPLMDALLAWETTNSKNVAYVTKGSNPWVEHFSAVRAEVVDPEDPTTDMNTEFIKDLMQADEILLAGEARSHCLANTVRDIANSFGDDSFVRKCVLLTDGTSDVTNFEVMGEAFHKEMVSRGMRTTTCANYLS